MTLSFENFDSMGSVVRRGHRGGSNIQTTKTSRISVWHGGGAIRAQHTWRIERALAVGMGDTATGEVS